MGVNTLSSSPLRTNSQFISQQLADLAEKMNKSSESQAAQAGRMGGLLISGASGSSREKESEESNLRRVALDSAKCIVEQAKGTATHILKDAIFNRTARSTQ